MAGVSNKTLLFFIKEMGKNTLMRSSKATFTGLSNTCITHDILGSNDPPLQQQPKVPFGAKIIWSRFTQSCSAPFIS